MLVTSAEPRRSRASAVEQPVPVPISSTVWPFCTSASAHIRTTSGGSMEQEVGTPPCRICGDFQSGSSPSNCVISVVPEYTAASHRP